MQLEAPAAERNPLEHCVALKEPSGQKEPGGQGRQVAEETAPTAADSVPGEQGEQVELLLAPVAEDHVPGGHGVGSTEKSGQKAPAGQTTGDPDRQKYDAGHGPQDSWRMRWFA